MRFRIPKMLSLTICRRKLWRQSQVWMCLKSLYSTHYHKSDIDIHHVAELCGCSPETVKRAIAWMHAHRWAFTNEKGYTILMGLRRVCQVEGVRYTGRGHSFNVRDMRDWKICVVKYAINHKIRDKHYHLKKIGHAPGTKALGKQAVPVSLREFAKYLGSSLETAHRWVKALLKRGVIFHVDNWNLLPEEIELRESLRKAVYLHGQLHLSKEYWRLQNPMKAYVTGVAVCRC